MNERGLAMTKLVMTAVLMSIAVAPAMAQTVKLALTADIRSTNPGVNRDDNTDGVVLNMVEGLVGYAEDGTVKPLLARGVDRSADGLTYTFRLRPGVKFHNGAVLKASDVAWNWRRYMDPKTEWRCLGEFDGRNGLKVEALETPDDETVVMRLNKPSAIFLDTLARTDCGMTAIVHADSLKPDGTWDKPVGTGPFRLGEWRRGQSLTLVRFDDYAPPPGETLDGYVGAKKPEIAEARLIVVPDAATVKVALLTGAVDITQAATSDIPELKARPDIVVETPSDASKHAFLFQTRDPLLSNPKLRQAIGAALDLDQLVEVVSDGTSTASASAVFRNSAYYDAVQQVSFGYDPARARRLLQEAGYKGEQIRIVANKRAPMPSFQAALVGQAMLRSAGINAEIEVLEWATQLDRYNAGNYQMMSFSYSARLDPALSFEQFTGPKDKQPRKVWDNPAAQALLDRSMVEADPARRGALFDDLHRMMLADVPLIILYNGSTVWAHARRISGFRAWEGKPRLWGTKIAG